MRQHMLGPYPFDPNLIAQGVPPDDRVDFTTGSTRRWRAHRCRPARCRRERRPVCRRPVRLRRAAAVPPVSAAGAAASGRELAQRGADTAVGPRRSTGSPLPAPPPVDGAVPAAPSAFGGNGSGGGPSVAFAHYDPRTGDYVTPDGLLQQQTNVAAGAAPKSWKDLLPI